MIHAYQLPSVIQHAPATQGVHGLGHRRSTSANEIGDVLLSERNLKRIPVWARRPKHQGQFAQGLNESRLDRVSEDSDQFPFRPFLPGFEFGAEESGELRTLAYETVQFLMRNFG